MSEENDLVEIVKETIIKHLAMPKEIQSEAGTVRHHSLSELIQLQEYLEQKKASKKGMRFIKIEPQ
jgi:hypothetical protein